MTDRVLIEALAVETVIGVYDWERDITQRLLVDLSLCWDIRSAAATDDVGQALDYGEVSARVRHYFAEHQPALLETAAEGLASCLMTEFGIGGLELTLRKPGAVPGARAVGIRIARGDLS